MEMRPNQIVTHTTELESAMNETLSEKWELCGLRVVSIALGSVTLPEEDQELIKTAQKNAMFRDPTMAAAGALVGSQADAMKAAASNSAGAMTGFMGMGMAHGAGGVNAQDLFAMGQKQQVQQNTQQAQAAKAPAGSWKCSCGAVNKGKFCSECGAKCPGGEEGL